MERAGWRYDQDKMRWSFGPYHLTAEVVDTLSGKLLRDALVEFFVSVLGTPPEYEGQ